MRKLLSIAIFLLAATLGARAQGMFFSGIAQSVATIPGSAQGVSNVFVPIPNATIYVCTGLYSGSACTASSGTLASVYSCQSLSGCSITQPVVGDQYGNFDFWAEPGTYYYTVTGQVSGSSVTGSYQIILPAVISGTTVSAPIFNATTGFEVNGSAPSDHVLLGNGSQYVDSSTIPASIITGLPGSYYQTVQQQGTSQTQEANLNFASAVFALSDSSGNHQTNVNVNQTGTGTYMVTALSSALPGTSTATAVFDGNGNLEPGLSTTGSGTLIPTVSSTEVDDWFTATGCSVTSSSNLATCSGTITFTSGGNTSPSFPAMADTSYMINCTVDSGSVSGFAFSLGNPSNTTSTPSFAQTTSTFEYVLTEIMSNGGNGSSAPRLNCHLHHN